MVTVCQVENWLCSNNDNYILKMSVPKCSNFYQNHKIKKITKKIKIFQGFKTALISSTFFVSVEGADKQLLITLNYRLYFILK